MAPLLVPGLALSAKMGMNQIQPLTQDPVEKIDHGLEIPSYVVRYDVLTRIPCCIHACNHGKMNT